MQDPKGSSISIMGHDGATALHVPIQERHLAATKMLVKAVVDLDLPPGLHTASRFAA